MSRMAPHPSSHSKSPTSVGERIPSAHWVRGTRVAASAIAALIAGLTLAPTASAGRAYEQVSRADGVSGASPLEGGYSQPNAITSDGRTGIFTFSAGYNTPGWGSATGIWRRDVDTNRSTQLIGGKEAIFTGLTADESTMSFITSRRLLSADVNNHYDLYSYTLATKKIALLSRWNGPDGQAIGLITPLYNSIYPGGTGFITRDGRSALFSTDYGIGKRDLAANTTVKVDSVEKQPLGFLNNANDRGDLTTSADGRVFASGADLITPGGTIALGAAYPDAGMLVSESGAVAAFAPSTEPTKLTVIDTAARTQRKLDLASIAPDGFRTSALTPDDQSIDLWVKQANGEALKRVNLATSAVTDLGLDIALPGPIASAGARFALAGYAFATAATGQALPGGVDLPSPGEYVSITSGCKGAGWPFNQPSMPSQFNVRFHDYGTPVSSVTYRITNSTGGVTHSGTVTQDLYIPEVKPFGQALKVQVTVRYADGRSTSENWSHPAPAGCLGFF